MVFRFLLQDSGQLQLRLRKIALLGGDGGFSQRSGYVNRRVSRTRSRRIFAQKPDGKADADSNAGVYKCPELSAQNSGRYASVLQTRQPDQVILSCPTRPATSGKGPVSDVRSTPAIGTCPLSPPFMTILGRKAPLKRSVTSTAACMRNRRIAG